MTEVNDWFDLPEEATPWLIHGLLTADDCAGFNGKPKSGKSTSIRNLAAAVVLGGKFLNREVCVPPNTGRVLYIHLDRKDRKNRVAQEFRKLGITREASPRLRFLTEQDMPKDVDLTKRCTWLAEEATSFKPDLIVIDLLLHFAKSKKGVNDYDTMIDAIAQMQDALTGCGYVGALLVSLHARKASGEDVGDSVLGSTGIRGSLSTLLHFHHYRKEKIYTVLSDQSVRDEALGEIEETIVNRDPATGIISLGAAYEAVKREDKKSEWELRRQKILRFVKDSKGKTSDEISIGLSMSKKTVLPFLEELETQRDIFSQGNGKKRDPKKYFFRDVLPTGCPNIPTTPPNEPTRDWFCTNYKVGCENRVFHKGDVCESCSQSAQAEQGQEVTCVS